MSAPRLNRAMVLETASEMSDGAGGFTETWAALGTLWAEVKPRTGREREREAVSASRMDYRITVRAAPVGSLRRPEAGQRLREGDRVFRLLAVTEKDPEARYLTCFATEETAA